jgi:hypothetical protein
MASPRQVSEIVVALHVRSVRTSWCELLTGIGGPDLRLGRIQSGLEGPRDRLEQQVTLLDHLAVRE